MEFGEARNRFLEAWGSLGSSWGINHTMAQIHALLLISTDALSTEDVMRELEISRGNANMNLRSLVEWGLLYKVKRIGERKEYFAAKQDIWEVARQIARERRKRELEPVIELMNEIGGVNGESADHEHFQYMTKQIADFASQTSEMLEVFSKRDIKWFSRLLKKLK